MTDIEAVRSIGLADTSLQNEVGNGGFIENVPLPTSCLSFNKCPSSAKWHNILMTLQNASIGSSRVLDEDVATVLKEAIACADNDIQWNGSGIIELLKRAVDLAENGNIEGSRKAAVGLLDFHKMVEKYREVMVRQPSITDNSDTIQFGFPEIPLDSIESNKRRPVNLGSTGSLLSRSLSLSVSNDCKQLASVRDNFDSHHDMSHSTLPYADEFHEVKDNYSEDVLPSNSATSHVDDNFQVNQENQCGNSCDFLGRKYDASYINDKIVTTSLSKISMDNVVPSTRPLGPHHVSFDVSLSGTDASNKLCDTSFESGFNNRKKMPTEFHFFDAMNVLSEVCAHASSDDEIEELDRDDVQIADFDFRTRQASVNESPSYGKASTCTSPNALAAPASCSEELISNVSSISSQNRMTTVPFFERSSLLISPPVLSSKSLSNNAGAPPSRSDSFQFRVPPPIHTISRPKIVHVSPPPSLSSSAPRHLTSNGMNRSSNLHSPIQFQNQIRNQMQPHSYKTPQLSQVSRYSVHSSTVATRRWTGRLLSYASSLLANSSPYPSFSKGLSCPVIVGRTVPYCELSMEVPVEHCECLGTALPVSRISSRHGVKLTRHFACKCQISFTCMEQMEKLKRMAAQELVFFVALGNRGEMDVEGGEEEGKEREKEEEEGEEHSDDAEAMVAPVSLQGSENSKRRRGESEDMTGKGKSKEKDAGRGEDESCEHRKKRVRIESAPKESVSLKADARVDSSPFSSARTAYSSTASAPDCAGALSRCGNVEGMDKACPCGASSQPLLIPAVERERKGGKGAKGLRLILAPYFDKRGGLKMVGFLMV